MSPVDRHTQLKQLIEVANHEYHVVGVPTLTDAEYDAHVRELRQIEKENPALAVDSPTLSIGGKATGTKVKHARPMLSLDNAFTKVEVANFFKAAVLDLVWEPKVDGLSLSLIYEDGHLIRAATRGDGKEGDDVTHNAFVISSIPKTIPIGGEVEVRGEVCITKTDFEALIEQMVKDGDEPFANARNAAAGSLKLKDSAECALRPLTFYAYRLFGVQAETQLETIDTLSQFGFLTVESSSLDVSDTGLAQLNETRKRLPYDTDGIVLKVNKVATQELLGDGTKSPKWALAFKFPPDEGISKLEDVVLQVGRTGTLTPVAILSPVTLNGAVVRRASLCNFDEIERLDIAVGDDVVVVRAAEVIPKVIRVHQKAADRKSLSTPKCCPCCGHEVVRDETVVAVRCSNFRCPDQVFERLSHAVSKSSLDWDGMGTGAVKTLLKSGKVASLSDLFTLSETDIESLFKTAARKKFIQERERMFGVPLWRKLHALGIEGVGKTFCQELAFKYGDLMAILADGDGVSAILGPNRAKKFFFEMGKMADEIERLYDAGFEFVEVASEKPKTGATGKSFVITGSLMTGTRSQVASRIEEAGGIVKSSVSKTTDFLVVGEAPGGNKTRAAQKHGTKTITEDELYVVLGIDVSELDEDPLAKIDMEDL